MTATGVGMIYDSLMAGSPDEESTEYGLIAEWVSFPPDFSSATFGLRPEARFYDGKPITADDVIFSLDALKKSHPMYARYYKNVVKAEKTGDNEVTFTFDIRAIASCLRFSASSRCCRSTTGKARARTASSVISPRPRSKSRLVGSLQDQELRSRQPHLDRARAGLLGEGSAGLDRQVEF